MSEFLLAIPEDAKRGALKRIAAGRSNDIVDEVTKEIEDASTCPLFADDDE